MYFVLQYFGRYPAMGSARYRWGAWR